MFKEIKQGFSWWLRLHTFTAGGRGLDPWLGKLHMPLKKKRKNTADIPKVPLTLHASPRLNEKVVVRRASDTFGRENSTLKMERLE